MKRLLHYEIEREIGRGGMGVVYEARDTHLDRTVAIKILPADKLSDASRKQRFTQEAKSASALNHPNIVTIYDVNSDQGVDFIVMEYIAGKTLDALIASKSLRPRQSLRYAVQVADALARAHGSGILHRDVKPSNIIVTDDGRIKLLDFGLAKLTDREEISQDDATVTEKLFTEEGSIVGTAAYMSPEQAEGRKLDGRSEIFSFGTVLYEMITGQRPFHSESRITLLSKIVNEDPKPLSDAVSPALAKTILRCLRKDPARRFQTMADLKVALEDLVEESTTATGPAAPAQSHKARRYAAFLLPVLLAAAVFTWLNFRPEKNDPLTAVALTTFSGSEQHPTFSPDGSQVAFMWNGPTQSYYSIYVQLIGSGTPLRLTNETTHDLYPAWSPDGRSIAFLRSIGDRRFDLRLVPPLGGPSRKVAEIQARKLTQVSAIGMAPRPAWSPDSRFLFVTDSPGEGKSDAIFAISVESGEKRQVTDPPATAEGDVQPAVSPGGRSLVIQRMLAFNATELYVLPIADGRAAGEPKRITTVPINAMTAAWTSETQIVFSSRSRLWRLDVSRPSAPPVRLPYVGEDGVMPALSRTQGGKGTRLAYVRSFSDYNLWKVETAGPGTPASGPPSLAISSSRIDRNPQFSPDGRRVAFQSDRSGALEIWLSDPDGSNAVQLTFLNAPSSGTPRWSPDGQTITFDSNLEGQYEIYAVPASGGKPRRLTDNPANDSVTSFSHDGKWLYFQSNRGGQPQIWRMPSAGGEPTRVTPNIGYTSFESHDGAWLYYTETSNPPSPLWRISTSGGAPEKILDTVLYRGFSVLEKGIYYVGVDPKEGPRLEFYDFLTRKSLLVSPLNRVTSLGLSASPDGRTILYSQVDSAITDIMLVENFR